MKAYEFPTKITHEGTLEVPDALLKLLPDDEVVRVLILVNEPSDGKEEVAWAHLTTEQFLAGYSEADAVYDRL